MIIIVHWLSELPDLEQLRAVPPLRIKKVPWGGDLLPGVILTYSPGLQKASQWVLGTVNVTKSNYLDQITVFALVFRVNISLFTTSS